MNVLDLVHILYINIVLLWKSILYIFLLTTISIIANYTVIYPTQVVDIRKGKKCCCNTPVVVVCHDQVRLQVSQGFRCRDS